MSRAIVKPYIILLDMSRTILKRYSILLNMSWAILKHYSILFCAHWFFTFYVITCTLSHFIIYISHYLSASFSQSFSLSPWSSYNFFIKFIIYSIITAYQICSQFYFFIFISYSHFFFSCIYSQSLIYSLLLIVSCVTSLIQVSLLFYIRCFIFSFLS